MKVCSFIVKQRRINNFNFYNYRSFKTKNKRDIIPLEEVNAY